MKTLTAREIINQEYGNSKNFMTPHVIKRGKAHRNIAYELSSGEGFNHEPIYGVSIAMIDENTRKTKRLYNDSHMFNSLAEAKVYINDYKQQCQRTTFSVSKLNKGGYKLPIGSD
tara:strand:+ start:870 stop:1214 length:345 start_codon:yes stop_codon:yes gene_type:complete